MEVYKLQRKTKQGTGADIDQNKFKVVILFFIFFETPPNKQLN